ncbi:MAG: PKD domain-containing protein, partial [Methanoregula sp.]
MAHDQFTPRWALFAFLVVLIIPCCAAGAPVISIGNYSGNFSEQVSLTVNMTGAANIGSIQYTLTYDPQILTLMSPAERGSLLPNSIFTCNYPTPGRINVGIVDSDGISGAGSLMTIRVNTTGAPNEKTALTLDVTEVKNASDFSDVPCTVTSGSFVVGGSLENITVTLSAPTTTVPYGHTVSIPINCSAPVRVGAMDFVLNYDPTVLTYGSTTTGPLSAGSILAANGSEQGKVRISLASTEGFSNSGTVALVTFSVWGRYNASSPLLIRDATVYEHGTELPVPVATVPGSVVVSPFQNGTMGLFIGNGGGSLGNYVEIPVAISGAHSLGSMDVKVAFNSSVLQLVNVTHAELAQTATLEYNTTPGNCSVSFFSATAINGNGTVYVMRFLIRSRFNSSINVISAEASEAEAPFASIPLIVGNGSFTYVDPPVAGFTMNVTSGSVPLTVQFNDMSNGTPTSWNWSFGDGNFSTLQHPAHTYTSTGRFTVSLNATNVGGSNVSTRVQCIAVYLPYPGASFTANVTSGQAPLPVLFSDLSTNNPNGWAWYFGDENWSESWTRVNASAGWSARRDHSSVAMPDGSIILMGGWNGVTMKNDVWRSTDTGATWSLVNASAGWSARRELSSVALPDGSIVITGGCDSGGLKNDTWRSTDYGANWTRMTANAKWSKRSDHSSVAMPDGSIIITGGWLDYGRYTNDTWRSIDNGATWSLVNASSGWTARYHPSSVVLSDRSISLMGGEDTGGLKNDTWRSTDNGATWTQLTASAEWSARREHSSVVMLDKSIILMGGEDIRGTKNDTWRSTDNGATWTQLTASAGWAARGWQTCVAVPDGGIILAGGWDGSSNKNDVWRFVPTGSSVQNPVHIYTVPGTYTVSLQAYNANGYSSTKKTGYITVTQSPTPKPNMLNGTIFYSGNENAPVYVYLFNQTPAPGVIPFKTKNLTYYGTPIKYGFTAGNGTFWVMSYMDINGNHTPDANEPWGFAINRTSQQGPDPIQVTGNVTGLDMTLFEPQLYISLMLTKGYNVNTTNNTILAGTQDSRLGYQMVLFPTTPSESSFILGNLSFMFAAQNISNVDHKQFAIWNSSTAVWTFPPEFTLKMNNGQSVTADTSTHTDKPLNMSLSREVNRTVFAENGTQLLTVNITFTSTDSLASGCIIDVPHTTRVHTRFIPDSVSTNAPTKWIDVYDQWVMFDFNQTAIRAGVPYTLSIISQVAPNGTPVEFIPRVSASQTFYHNSTLGTLTPVGIMPSDLLPKEVTMASAAVNVSGIWDFTIQHDIGATLDCVLQPASSAPVANFSASPTSGTAPLTVRFSDVSTNNPTTWNWNFGDGSTVNATVQHPVHTYTNAGIYTVSLNATNAIGSNSKTVKDYITVTEPIPPPVANFSASPTSGTAPLTVRFSDVSTNNPTTWNWNFGDGSIVNATVQHPVHTYTNAGIYTVSLNATNAGGSNTTTRTNYIMVIVQAPVANFSASPTSGTAPLTVRFSDVSTNNPTTWNWNFGDGSTVNATVQHPVHTYTNAGIYTVSLNATNAGGSNTTTRTNYITVIVQAPVANFSASPTSGTAPLTVRFSDVSTNNPTTWNWNFGDGSTVNATVQHPVHTYTNAGIYTVSLNATNAGGSNTTTRTNYITVIVQAPVANFSASPTSGTAPLTVRFTDTSTNSPTVWNWNFGDGSTATDRHPVHTYAVAGTYTVSLN